ncbi:MAG: carboxylesterase family protein, partial [Hyphomonadaceae bacterium]
GREGNLIDASDKVTERLGGADTFHTASTAEIFDAFTLDDGNTDLPRVIQDGVSIPSTPLRDAFSSTDTFNAVPIITGTNRDEMKLFQVLNPEFTRTRLGQFIVARDQSYYSASSDYGSRIWRIRAVDMPAAQMAAAGHDQVYAYRFDWDDGGRVFLTNLKKLLGASHAMEIPFVFNRFELLGAMDRYMFQKKTFAARDALSRNMGTYWASFARDGVPANGASVAWPAYAAGGEALMRFDSETDGGIGLIHGADSFEAILADIKADKRLNAAERCRLGVGLAVYLPRAASELGCGA